MRAAVGAGRVRLIRQMLTESVVLALLAGTGGVIIARWGVSALLALAPEDLPRLSEVTVDLTRAAVCARDLAGGERDLRPRAGVARVARRSRRRPAAGRQGIGARRARRLGAQGVRRDRDRARGGAGDGRGPARPQPDRAGAGRHGLQERSPRRAEDRGAGVGPRSDFPRAIATYRIDARRAARDARRHRRRRRHVAADRGAIEWRLLDPGRTRARGARHEVAAGALQRRRRRTTSSTLQVPVVRGRDFNDGDRLEAPFVAIINEQLAKDAFPGCRSDRPHDPLRPRLARADDDRRHRQGRAHARSRRGRCRPRSSCRTNSIRARRRRSTS